jgi:Arc/MetJ family transcription regulator
MRTTLTLDDDVAAKLRQETRKSGKTFRKIVNEAIRRGLESRRKGLSATPFRVVARDLGKLRPGINLDNVAELLDRVEGPRRR